MQCGYIEQLNVKHSLPRCRLHTRHRCLQQSCLVHGSPQHQAYNVCYNAVVHRCHKSRVLSCVQHGTGGPTSKDGSAETSNSAQVAADYKAMLALATSLLHTQQAQQQGQQQQQQQPNGRQQNHQQHGQQQQRPQPSGKQRLELLARSLPLMTSMPFLMWLADLEASAVGPQKKVLAEVCEVLVLLRERMDQESLDKTYQASLQQIAQQQLLQGTADSASQALARITNAPPEEYAVQLAQALTGAPVVTQGFDPVYDILLQVSPPAALTPEGVRQAHEQAQELAEDMRNRRKRSVASIIGRAKLSPEQADQLMMGSAAARILDMLLTLPSTTDRVACLPDCFTPPPEDEADQGAGSGQQTGSDEGRQQQQEPAAAAAQQQQQPQDADHDTLWCTPSQMLNELESRLRALSQPSGDGSGAMQPGHRSLAPADSQQLVGEQLLRELMVLRDAIKTQWLQSMPMSS